MTREVGQRSSFSSRSVSKDNSSLLFLIYFPKSFSFLNFNNPDKEVGLLVFRELIRLEMSVKVVSNVKVPLTAIVPHKFEAPSNNVLTFLSEIHDDESVISSRCARLLESVLKDAESTPHGSESLQTHFLRDIVKDLMDLRMVSTEQEQDSIQDHSRESYYPRVPMSGASVIVFPNRTISDKVAAFISNTSIAYKATTRDNAFASDVHNYRVSLISEERSGAPAVNPIDFSNETEYWAFIEAVNKSVVSAENATAEGSKFHWSGKGVMQNVDSPVAKFLSATTANTNTVEITTRIVVQVAGGDPFELPLTQLKGLALSCDWRAPSDFVMEICTDTQHQQNMAGFTLALLDKSLEVVRNPQYYHTLLFNSPNSKDQDKETLILVPVSMESLDLEVMPNGLNSIAVIRGKDATQTDANEDKAALAAIDTIPLGTFKKSLQDTSESNATSNFRALLDRPCVRHIKMVALPSHWAVQVHILGAVNLPFSAKGVEPSCYCAVYLVNAQGEKINGKGNVVSRMFSTFEEGEWKTDVIKSKTNPMWDTKLVLQCDGEIGIDAVASVRIVIKDVSSRFKQRKHIGQVTIPIGCFMRDAPVPLMLPLEPTYKMNGKLEAIDAELHVMTQTVEVHNGKVVEKVSNASVVKPLNRAKSSWLSKSKTDDPDKISVQYTLKPGGTDALNVFWPFTLMGGNAGNGTCIGNISLGQNGILISMLSGGGSILENCYEYRTYLENMAGDESGHKHFCLDWSAVEDVLPITTSVLTLRVIVHKPKSGDDKKSRRFRGIGFDRKNASQNFQNEFLPASVCLFVAPCPSKAMQLGILERQKLSPLWVDLAKLRTLVLNRKSSEGSALKAYQDIFEAARFLVRRLEDSATEHSAYDEMKSLGPACVRIEELSSGFSSANRWSSRVERDRSGVLRKAPEKNAGTAAMLVAKEVQSIITSAIFDEYDKAIVFTRTKIRALLYRIKLMDVCKGLSRDGFGAPPSPVKAQENSSLDVNIVPVYSITEVQRVFILDREHILNYVSYFADNLATKLFELHSMIVNFARNRIQDYILCSADAESELQARECLRELIECYYNLLRDSFHVYLGSPGAFKHTPGQEAKIMLLQMVVFCDDILDSFVRKHIWCVNGKLARTLTTLDAQYKRQDVIEWYASSLQAETAQWLSKTIKQAALFKNNSNLPWDYHENGEHVISSLPETVMTQNHSFLELCDRTATKFAFVTASVFPKKNESGELFESEIDKLRGLISFEMTESSNRCLLLLAEEYETALLTKNWSKPSNTRVSMYNLAKEREIEEEDNFMFLLSVANDCHRIIDLTNSAIEKDANGLNVASAKKVLKKFTTTVDLVMTEIFRFIFAEVHELIIDFRNEWENQVNLVFKKLLHNVTSYLYYTKKKFMQPKYQDAVVGYCANVICGCFLLMIRSRAAEDKKFVGTEFSRLKADFLDLKQKLYASLERDPDLGDPVKPVTILEDIAEVMSMTFEPIVKKTGSTEEDASKANSQLAKLMTAVTHSYSRKVAHGILKDGVYMRATLDREVVQLLSASLNSPSAVANMDSFTVEGKELPMHERMFYMMCEKIYEKNVAHGVKAEVDFFKGLRLGLSDAFGGSNENDKKVKETNVRLLKLLNLEDMDADERILEARKRRDFAALASGGMISSGQSAITLTISRVEVRGVISASYFSSANPYVAFNIGEQRMKTDVSWGAKNGSAKFSNVLNVTYNSSNLAGDTIEIEVNDKERVRRKRLIGKVTVKLGGLDLHRIENWFALKGGEKDGAEVFICIDLVKRETF